MARKDERSNAQHSMPNAEFGKGAPALRLQTPSINSRSANAIDLGCLTSTAALRESIHQRSRSNRDSGADNCWQTVFTIDE